MLDIDFEDIKRFQSTPSAWRVTLFNLEQQLNHLISIHTLRVEGDPNLFPTMLILCIISIHTLRVEGDDTTIKTCQTLKNFNPHPPRGG